MAQLGLAEHMSVKKLSAILIQLLMQQRRCPSLRKGNSKQRSLCFLYISVYRSHSTLSPLIIGCGAGIVVGRRPSLLAAKMYGKLGNISSSLSSASYC